MSRINWLADVLREAGLRVVEVDGWKTRGTSGLTPIGVMEHHTAGALGRPTPSLNICINGRAGLPGPLCNVYIGRDLVCYVVASGIANHAGTGGPYGRIPKNSGGRYTVGFEIEHAGTAAEAWPPALVDVAARATAAVASRIKAEENYAGIGHKEWAPTRKVDPYAWNMKAFRNQVAGLRKGVKRFRTKTRTTLAAIAAALGITVASLVGLNPGIEANEPIEPSVTITAPAEAPARETPIVEPVAPPTTAPAKPVPAPPSTGSSIRWSAATEGHQRQLNALGYGLAVDGYKGPATTAAIRDVQRRCGIAVDGYYGPDTTRCVNNLIAGQRAGTSAVVKYGDSGAKVVTLQKKLNRIGYSLAVDGHAGPRTIGAVYDVQVRCGLVRDRVAGPYTQVCIDNLAAHHVQTRVLGVGSSGADVRAAQAIVGAKVDGHFGWETYGKVLAYQRANGLQRDGYIGPRTSRAFGWTWRG